jgi:hypothetical protein
MWYGDAHPSFLMDSIVNLKATMEREGVRARSLVRNTSAGGGGHKGVF